MRPESDEKVNIILLGALSALTEKGYSNTTIEHIARSAHVSRGLLHYYFKDKETIIARAISLGSDILLSTAIGRLGHADSAESLADIMIEVLRQNVEQNPAITALLIEVWGESRRNAKLRMAFETGFNEVAQRLTTLLSLYVPPKTGSRSRSVDVTGRILLALYQGLAIEIISQPELVNDSQFRDALKSIVVHALHDVQG